MTPAANQLTQPAKRSGAARSRVATEPMSSARVYLEALSRLGYDREGLARAAGLPLAQLDNPDARVPCTVVGALLRLAMQTRPLKNFGMRLAMETPIGAFPLVDYLVVTSEDVGRGLEQLARYFRLLAGSMSWRFQPDDDSIRVIYEGPVAAAQCEFCTTLCLLHLGRETDGVYRAEYVSFTHGPDDPDEMARVVGCDVRGPASFNGWAMSRRAWQLPMRRRDPVLGGVLERQADEMLRRLPAADGLTRTVREMLVARVGGGNLHIGHVARELATSPRSLQRRLAEEGTSYQTLVDSTRRTAAERHVRERSLAISEIAFLLGYSEPAAFHRAFRRWTGVTPQAFRAQQP